MVLDCGSQIVVVLIIVEVFGVVVMIEYCDIVMRGRNSENEEFQCELLSRENDYVQIGKDIGLFISQRHLSGPTG